MRDFHCDPEKGGRCGIYFEELVYDFEDKYKCPNCGHEAVRIISAPHINWRGMGVSKDFPTAAEKWTKMQYEKNRKDKGGRADGQPNLKEY